MLKHLKERRLSLLAQTKDPSSPASFYAQRLTSGKAHEHSEGEDPSPPLLPCASVGGLAPLIKRALTSLLGKHTKTLTAKFDQVKRGKSGC